MGYGKGLGLNWNWKHLWHWWNNYRRLLGVENVIYSCTSKGTNSGSGHTYMEVYDKKRVRIYQH